MAKKRRERSCVVSSCNNIDCIPNARHAEQQDARIRTPNCKGKKTACTQHTESPRPPVPNRPPRVRIVPTCLFAFFRQCAAAAEVASHLWSTRSTAIILGRHTLETVIIPPSQWYLISIARLSIKLQCPDYSRGKLVVSQGSRISQWTIHHPPPVPPTHRSSGMCADWPWASL